jgi:hypothetical protein
MQDSYMAVASSWGFFFLVAVTLALLAIDQEEVGRSRIPQKILKINLGKLVRSLF